MNHPFAQGEVTPVKKKMSKERLMVSGVVGIIVIILFFTVASGFYQVVEPSHKAVVIKGGELQEEVKDNGFYMKMPFWTQIVPMYIGTLSTDEDDKGNFKEENPFRGIEPLSKDGQVLQVDAQINYAITDPEVFRERTGSTDPRTIEQLAFIPLIRRVVYDYASEYTWKGLIQEGDRAEFGQRIYQVMSSGEITKRTCKEETRVIDEKTGTETIIEAGCEVAVIEQVESASTYGVSISAVNFKKIEPNQEILNAVKEAQTKEQEVKNRSSRGSNRS